MWKPDVSPALRVMAWAALLATGTTSLPGADDFVEPARPPQPLPAFPQAVPFVPQPVPLVPERPLAAPVRPKLPSLGIMAGPLPPAVRAQVDVPDGVGLLVERLAEDGPAAEAGLQQFDLLVKFDDQLVCSPQQLDTLVRMAGAGAKASLTIRRGGRERVLEATIEERDDALQQFHADAWQPWQQGHVVPDGPWLALPPGGLIPGAVPPDAGNLAEEIRRRVEEAIGAAQPGFVPAPGDVQPRPPLPPPPPLRSQGMTVMSDESGTIELREQDGSLTVTIRDPEGAEIHSGGLDTEADREAVPEEFRDKVNAAAGRLRRRGGPPRAVPPQRPAADPALPEDREKPDPDAI